MKKLTKAKRQARTRAALETAESVRLQYLAMDLEPKRTPSGLGYLIHQPGDGPRLQPGQAVTINYAGLLVADGTVFDESFSRSKPFRFRLGIGEVIAGWDEGVDLLRVGDVATLFIPAKLGYGSRGSGPIPGGAELLFYLEVL